MSGSKAGCASMVFCASIMLLGSPSAVQAASIPCKTVVAELDRVISQSGSHEPDSFRVARRLGVDRLWVERCAEVYGRRLKHTASTSDLEREKYEEQREAEEPSEIGREEKEAGGEASSSQVPEEEEKRSRVQKVPPTMHEWDPTLTGEWDPVFKSDWEPFLREEE